jgi:signal transduction histidine kinase
VIPHDYCGRILKGEYSLDLKKRVAEYIANYRAFERTGNPAIPYISAWQEDREKSIWYEYVSRRLASLLGCEPADMVQTFRDSIQDRIIYRYSGADADIQKEIFSRQEIDSARESFREDGKREGVVDAVYKLGMGDDHSVWLKDLARVETHEQDRVCISIGCLTVVSKEMRAEEERVERERLQVLLQTAGAVCHEMNQPMQSITGYSESLLLDSVGEGPFQLKVQKIIDLTQRMGEITKKLMRITKYETKDYVEGVKIVDLDKSTS